MSDKVRGLAEKLAGSSGVGGYKTELARFERILRAELKPLLEAAWNCATAGPMGQAAYSKALTAELQHWHSMERTPER